ncbi:MAG: hypothetical protein ACI83O_000495 [Patescibacteria group bacterium]
MVWKINMEYIECPQPLTSENTSIFLAGGITGCEDWQKNIVELLKNQNVTLINPRRANYDFTDPKAEEEQITWEYHMLKRANMILFYFPPETLCPITLYELGKALMSNRKIFIAVHPGYKRIRDVEFQTRLIKAEIEIVHSLEKLSHQIKKELTK